MSARLESWPICARPARRDTKLAQQQSAKLEDVFSQLQAGGAKAVQLLIKADVHGSAEALRDALSKLATDEIQVKVIGSTVGGITESDVNLAAAAKAIIIGFNVRADGAARDAVKATGVDVRYYSIIYEAIDDVKAAMSGMLAPEVREQIVGLAEVRDVFRSPKFGSVAGCLVVDGYVKRSNPGARAPRQRRDLRGRARFAAAFQGRRLGGPGRYRMRHRRAQLQRHQGRRPDRVL